MLNKELANAFNLMGDLLEIQGANRFRINSFRRTGRTLKDLIEDVAVLVEEDRLLEVPGIGKGTAGKIEEFIEVGRIAELDELLGKMPDGLPALLDIPGMGPKKVAAVWKELDIEELGDLKEAIEDGRLAELAGFGEQSVKKIGEGIRFMETSGERVPYGEALPLAEALAEEVGAIDGVKRVAIAGSLRRGRETVGDIDLLCIASDGAAVVRSFVALGRVASVLASGDTKGSVTVPLGSAREMQVDLRVVPEESFGAALQYFSGSKEHNVRLREMASKQGYKLNEWGLFKNDKQVAGRTEEEIYAKLGLPAIPVELREDRGEFECDAAFIETLITMADIRGDLHMHTVASDGKCTLEQLAEAAKGLAYEYINITDHSKSSAIANGLSIERMEQQIETVRAFDKTFKGLKVLVGCECDILSNGDLDYPDDLLAECDIVVASIHSAMGQAKEVITRRTIKAIENPHVHIIGHPTSRLLNKRPATAIDVPEIVKAAVETGTALEVNSAWKRLDLNDRHVRHAIDAGAMLSINTDSHDTPQLQQMRYGVATARRGWATADRVINTMSLKQLLAWKERMQ
ncbi:MAG: DNA polymerase/3'-5' exonuclease PolX [Planctomycetes bacterium]|nr:DNA polymerase/3'-5' exonuclease PolX [Planctomycetota bacterium]